MGLLDRFEVTGASIGYKSVDEFRAFLANPAANASDPAEGASSAPANASPFAGKSLWMIVLLTLLGGFALNFTPCVLPLIPVNIAIIGAGAKAGSKGRGFALGLAYGLGMTAVYGALGVIAALTTSTFGSINSSPWFNLSIAVVFVVLGLAMFDLLLIDFTRFQAKFGIRKNEGGQFGVALFMGAISALLAGACVAPVVIAVILFARNLYVEGSPLGLALPFVLGAGMALPWPFAGAGMTFLPKPGMWMVRVKQAFGVFILLFAAYYAHLAWTQFRPAAVDTEVSGPWERSLEIGLKRGLEQDKPVVVDFWATWCKNCLAMDKSTFKDPSVLKDLEGFVPVKYQAEQPGESPHREIMDRLGVMGLPTVVVLKPIKQ
jgi:thiol:disulfide interchange protein